MTPADRPIQRPRDAKLLAIDAFGRITHMPRRRFVDVLRPGDLVIANDAATLPASLRGVHGPSCADIEVRLAGRTSLAAESVTAFSAVVFGGGDFRTRTEDRALPPPLAPGDRLELGPLSATAEALLDHPRFVSVRFDGSPAAIWRAWHGMAGRSNTPTCRRHCLMGRVDADREPAGGIRAAVRDLCGRLAIDSDHA
jgi:S-adenosylmethionine:tRNA ribosyltransferase-isomerase